MRLQDFQKFRDLELIQPQRAQFVLSAFVLPASIWAGASVILTEYAIGNDYWFSFKLPVRKFGSNFIAAIRYEEDETIYRYKFWEDDDEVLWYPVYAGERIGLNAVLEIWSVNSANFPTLSSDKILYSSVLTFPPNQSCNACCSNPSSQTLLSATAPSVLVPYAYCNPFCNNLCSP